MNHALYVFFIVVAVFPFRLPLRKKNLIVQQISLIQMSLIRLDCSHYEPLCFISHRTTPQLRRLELRDRFERRARSARAVIHFESFPYHSMNFRYTSPTFLCLCTANARHRPCRRDLPQSALPIQRMNQTCVYPRFSKDSHMGPKYSPR